MEHIDLILHPVRMRIILTIVSRVLTTQQIADLLPDIAQTTLYRHINLLLEGGILRVVRESQVRGTVERELALVEGAGRIDMETSASLPPEQQEHIFTTIIAMLLANFRRSQAQPQTGLPPALYNQQHLYLTPTELLDVNQQIDQLLAAYKDPARTPDDSSIQPWLYTGITMPAADPPSSQSE